ncbi:MAG: hypothetical protein U0231_12805 [Nitrospiraceae bacterium]
MEVVGACRGPIKILQETGRTNADAVILAQEGSGEPGLCSQLLAVYPDLMILCLAPDGQTVYAQRLRSCRHKVPSPQMVNIAHILRKLIRSGIQR